MAVLLTVGTTRSTAFKAFDCNNASAPIEQYSLLDPKPCGNMQKVHAIERDLHGEIVQIKKERLVKSPSVSCSRQSRRRTADSRAEPECPDT